MSRRLAIAALLVGVALAGAAPAAARPPVVVIAFDEFPTVSLEGADGRVDPIRYPNFARLAGDSDWFPYSTASFDETGRAMESMLTGVDPSRHRPATYDKNRHNLFVFLGQQGYRMNVSEEVSSLCPPRLCPNVRPQTKQTVLHGLAHGRSARVGRWLRSVRASRRATLNFKHILLPHVPLRYLPSGRHYRDDPHEILPGLTRVFGARWPVTQAYQRHLLQVGFTDRLLGKIVHRLRREKLYDRSLVVVTADNGESFGRYGNRHEISGRNAIDIALTPLFIKRPFQRRGRIVRRHVRTLDLVPTIAHVVGLRVPWRTQGRSIFGASARGIPGSVRMVQRSGHRIPLSYAALRRQGRAALRHKLRLFGSGKRPPGLYGIGPEPRLLGTPLAIWPLTRAGHPDARINGLAALHRVRPRSAFLPTHITGRLVGRGESARRNLAFAVNGVIVATAPAITVPGLRGHFFSALVPESSLVKGRNDVRVFAIGRTTAGGLRLSALDRR